MARDFAQLGFLPADILLPAPQVDPARWSVVACDQYTSEPAYWQRVDETVGDAPSTLRITFPEVYLSEGFARVACIQETMRGYLAEGTLTQAVSDGFILVERTTPTGARLGLVGCIDLEAYDFNRGSASLVRATEGTVLERIPPRVRIRTGALLEAPHVMLLIDDAKRTVIEPLYAARESLAKLYDFELMERGGHLRGYRVDAPECKAQIAAALDTLYDACGGLLYAVGDGNHSLATARQCWLNLRDTLSEAERAVHPARYALVELVNLHDEALVFEPIHRVIFGADASELFRSLQHFTVQNGATLYEGDAKPGDQPLIFVSPDGEKALGIANSPFALPVATLQRFLDEYLAAHPGVEIDYIHGDDVTRTLGSKAGNVGFLLTAINKFSLFPAVRQDGVLPRKTFSMGEAYEKRYYMECRKIL